MDITSIRYINMDKNWHRKLFMKSLLGAMHYAFHRCPGVTFDARNDSFRNYRHHGTAAYLKEERIPGVVGCWIAHSHALEQVTERDGITVVLEDDFVCQPSFFEHALGMVNAFDRDFDIILFDAWGTGPWEVHKIAENIYRPEKCNHPYYGGTHCLFVRNARISKILAEKRAAAIMDYDAFLLTSARIDTYVFYTGECATRGLGSDVTPKHRFDYDLAGIAVGLLPYALRARTKRFKKCFSLPAEKKLQQFSGEKLKVFEGRYELRGKGNLYVDLVVRSGRLVLTQPWDNQEISFQPFSEVDFFSKEAGTPLEFTKDESGAVTQVRVNNHDVYRKNDTYRPVARKAVVLAPEQLKAFEGSYCLQQNKDLVIRITATGNQLSIQQLWVGRELHFVPESELEFFAKDNASFPIRFVKDKDGAVVRVTAFETSTFDKVND